MQRRRCPKISAGLVACRVFSSGGGVTRFWLAAVAVEFGG